ncbi:MAG: LptF/LptG family permease, partial [Sphingobacteriales bacterium]
LAVKDVERYLNPYFTLYQKRKQDSLMHRNIAAGKGKVSVYKKDFFDLVPDSSRQHVAQITESNLRNVERLVKIVSMDTKLRNENLNQFRIAWHKKFTLSFACMLLFLIGAPLGAIIRKGGMGAPVIIAIGFFIIYFIISSTSEKLAQQGAVKPWYGMWMASAILLPIAFIIMAAARNDSPIFSKETYVRLWSILRAMLRKKKTVKP